MALTITHSTVATGADDPSAEINKAEWNDDHVLTGDYLRKATVTLTSADILDLHNTPVTLVAAPGAGKWLNIHRLSSYFKYGTVQYTTSDLAYVQVGIAGSYAFAQTVSITGSSDAVDGRNVAQDFGATDFVNVALSAITGGTQFTLGDGTLTVTVWYSIEDVP